MRRRIGTNMPLPALMYETQASEVAGVTAGGVFFVGWC